MIYSSIEAIPREDGNRFDPLRLRRNDPRLSPERLARTDERFYMCLAIPGKITSIYQKDLLRMAEIDFGGISKEICLAYTPEAEVGDYALIHVGFAISLMDEDEAQETLKLIKEVAGIESEL